MQILVVGFGYVGKHLAQKARLRGHSVFATTRNPNNFGTIEENGAVPVLFGAPLPDSVTHIIVTTPPENGTDPFLNMYASMLPPSIRWVGYYSTTGVYGDADGDWVTEESPLNAKNPRATARITCEKLYQKHFKNPCILRLSGIYGGDKNMLTRLKEGSQKRPAPAGPINRVHVDDIVRLTLHLMKNSQSDTFNVSDDMPMSTHDTCVLACKKLGVNPNTLEQSDSLKAGFGGEGFRKVCNTRMKDALGDGLLYPSFSDFLEKN